MNENDKMTIDILHKLAKMNPDKITRFRVKMTEELRKKDPEMRRRTEEYINAVCDVAVVGLSYFLV